MRLNEYLRQFESNQSGIETIMLDNIEAALQKFESNQSGIETNASCVLAAPKRARLNRTRVELKHADVAVL